MELFIPFILTVYIIFFVLSINKNRNKKHQHPDVGQNQNINLLETVTKSDRGTYSERKLVLKLLEYGIPAQTIFHDLYVRKPNGNFSQIDLVIATTIGIVVFEVKDYSGWIFGTGYQSQWTQVLAYGKQKYRFYNPIIQNNKHIGALRKKLKQFENIPFYSVIVFDGDCELKNINFVPEGTFVVREERVLEVMKLLQAKEPASFTNKYEVIRVMREAVENGTHKVTELKHADKVNDMLGKHRVFN